MEYLYGFLAVILAVVVLRLLTPTGNASIGVPGRPGTGAMRSPNEAGCTRTRRPRTTTPIPTAVGPRCNSH